MEHMWNHITVIGWAVQKARETFQEALGRMNEGLCPVQTLQLHLYVSVILIPSKVAWNISAILTVLLQTSLWHPVT